MALISFVRWLPSSWMAKMASVMVSYSFFARLMADCCSSSCVFRESILWLIPDIQLFHHGIKTLGLTFGVCTGVEDFDNFVFSIFYCLGTFFNVAWMLSSFSCSSESSLLISPALPAGLLSALPVPLCLRIFSPCLPG